jgi:succinate dehydrogenase hydrophobic membrane anchor protein
MDSAGTGRSLVTWLLQRITGIMLVVFLFLHINFNHLTLGDRIIDFTLVNERLAGSFGWKLFYLLFVPSCVYHAMNGLWGILADYRPSVGFRKLSIAVLWLLGLALSYIGADTLFNLFRA